MATSQIPNRLSRAGDTLKTAFSEDHPPELIAASFAVGIFLTTLPSLGLIIPVLAWIGARFKWANRIALLASIAVMNPLAKGTVYVISFFVGAEILGSLDGVSPADIGLTAGADVFTRLLLGNLLVAICFAGVAYLLAYRTAIAVHRRQ